MVATKLHVTGRSMGMRRGKYQNGETHERKIHSWPRDSVEEKLV